MFYQNLCRFCSKFVWRKISVEKICVEKNDKYEVCPRPTYTIGQGTKGIQLLQTLE